MSTVNRNRGSGLIWRGANHQRSGRLDEPMPTLTKASGDIVSISPPGGRLATLAQSESWVIPAGPAHEIVLRSPTLEALVQNSVEHALGVKVNFGRHMAPLCDHIATALKKEGIDVSGA